MDNSSNSRSRSCRIIWAVACAALLVGGMCAGLWGVGRWFDTDRPGVQCTLNVPAEASFGASIPVEVTLMNRSDSLYFYTASVSSEPAFIQMQILDSDDKPVQMTAETFGRLNPYPSAIEMKLRPKQSASVKYDLSRSILFPHQGTYRIIIFATAQRPGPDRDETFQFVRELKLTAGPSGRRK